MLAAALAPRASGDPLKVTFTQSSPSVAAYDFVEISANVEHPDVINPFTDASLRGTFEKVGDPIPHEVEGFCDAADGSTFRIRFMPASPGEYRFGVVYRQGGFAARMQGRFLATDGHLRGPIRVDPKYPWHFIWEGTGRHYFFNGTTAYFLLGWRDFRTIRYVIDRLHRLQVNRIRFTIAGREDVFMGEPVMNGRNFTTYLHPWLTRPGKDQEYLHYYPGYEDMFHPGFDYTRFNLPFWRKLDRTLRYARSRNMVMSLVLDMNDNKVHPAAGSDDERRYIHYLIDRCAAFSNITWDLGDDLDRYRSDAWTHETGTLIEKWDPYHHLATSHPVDPVHQDRASAWFGFTSFQWWVRGREQHAFMLKERRLQEQTGRIIPQTNEEYGYEDHYPMWAPPPPGESADALRRTAWAIYMAGGYQTAGESARDGTNIWPDTGGGWLNGRGDDSMTLFVGYGHIVDFFHSFEWWKTNPHDELVNHGAYCLADPGKIYAVYLPTGGGDVTIRLEPGQYTAHWFGATTGEIIPLPEVAGPEWTSPRSPDRQDWALLLLRKHKR